MTDTITNTTTKLPAIGDRVRLTDPHRWVTGTVAGFGFAACDRGTPPPSSMNRRARVGTGGRFGTQTLVLVQLDATNAEGSALAGYLNWRPEDRVNVGGGIYLALVPVSVDSVELLDDEDDQ